MVSKVMMPCFGYFQRWKRKYDRNFALLRPPLHSIPGLPPSAAAAAVHFPLAFLGRQPFASVSACQKLSACRSS